jgi:glycine cleavage system H lipoate-binding protein
MQIPGADLFATKGIEYLLIIGFLLILAPFWRLVMGSYRKQEVLAVGRVRAPSYSWFRLDPNRYYHPGHSWALPSEGKVVTVGVDDFAQKLVGAPSAVTLPAPGTPVRQGEVAFTLRVNSRPIDVLSPIDGEVVERNDDVVVAPSLINRDPYGRGWLVRVKPARLRANLRSLLQGDLAQAWLDTARGALQQRIYGDLGVVMQDGGFPATGMAPRIAGDHWEDLVKDFLLTRDEGVVAHSS